MFQRAGLKKCSQAGGSGREARGGQQSPPQQRGVGSPAPPLLGLAEVLHQETLRLQLCLILGRGLKIHKSCSRGPNLLGGLVSSAVSLPYRDLFQSPSSPIN